MRAKNVLIATGAAPNHGEAIPGIEHVISSNEVFHLDEQPKRIVIQGGGYIALEFAGIFAGFGSQVRVVYRGDNILRGFDEDVREHLRDEMEKRGITMLTGCTVTKVDKLGSEFTAQLSNGASLGADQVMFAIGRHPDRRESRAGENRRRHQSEERRHRGRRFLATNVPHIYAVGDVTHRLNLTPVAVRKGTPSPTRCSASRPIAVDHATCRRRCSRSPRSAPSA